MTSSTATSNFHAGSSNSKSNFHFGERDFRKNNFHAGTNRSDEGQKNFHAGDYSAQLDIYAANFHAGRVAGPNSNLRTGEETNFHTDFPDQHANFHRGEPKNFHAGNFHAGEESNFHTGISYQHENFHRGESKNFHAGEESNFHSGKLTNLLNFHRGNYHKGCIGNQAEVTNKGNFHIGNTAILPPSKRSSAESKAMNFHGGNPFEFQAKTSVNKESEHVSKDFTAMINFYASTADSNKPYNYVEKPADSNIYSNVLTSENLVKVVDIRGRENQFDLDRNAVLAVSGIPDAGHSFTVESEVKDNFYPEVEKLLLDRVPGAQRVFIFDHTIRQKSGDRGPVMRAHIDQTPTSAIARVERHLPEEAKTLLNGRVRLINFWRPLNGTVDNFPLAFADSNSILNEDLEAVEHRYPDWTGETFGVKYRSSQKWFYWSGMTNNEALLLQCYDSQNGGRLPHSAVTDRSSCSSKMRESIEVRALVFG